MSKTQFMFGTPRNCDEGIAPKKCTVTIDKISEKFLVSSSYPSNGILEIDANTLADSTRIIAELDDGSSYLWGIDGKKTTGLNIMFMGPKTRLT